MCLKKSERNSHAFGQVTVLCKSVACSSRVVRTTKTGKCNATEIFLSVNLSWCYQNTGHQLVHVVNLTLASRFTLAFVDPCAGPAVWFCLNTLPFYTARKKNRYEKTWALQASVNIDPSIERYLFLAWLSIGVNLSRPRSFQKAATHVPPTSRARWRICNRRHAVGAHINLRACPVTV